MHWSSPSALPDLRRVDLASIDLETKDDGLASGRGPGWPWGGGHICGIAVGWRAGADVRAQYISLRHPDGETFDPEQVRRWLADLLASDTRIITHNGGYDHGWLRAEFDLRVPPPERIEDTNALAVMVDENRYSYKLDELCKWRGLPGKDDVLLRQTVLDQFGKQAGKNPQEHIWKLPARIVGAYAEADARATLALFEDLSPILDREGTRAAYRLECDLLPMVLEMERRGLRIDVDAAERARELIGQKRDAALVELGERLGSSVCMTAIRSPKWLARTFGELGIVFPSTEKGNPSFNKDWMSVHTHWAPRLITRAKKCQHAADIFVGKHILGQITAGRIYPSIHPHRSDDGGTVSFRFSYSNPPLQQMPRHDVELAPLIRTVFRPEEGEVWCTPDISQQEFRLITHYAAQIGLPGARGAMECYRTDPDTDFHAMVAEMTGLTRTRAKNVNFAKVFGAGPAKLASMIGMSVGEARAIMRQYDERLPFPRALSDRCKNKAIRCGYTVLYDGARRHWSRWGLAYWHADDAGPTSCDHDEAVRRVRDADHPWHRQEIRRVGTHTAMNALIQGSAARHTKLWMRACWREGIVPLLQMHDALELSVSSPEQAELVARLGETAVSLCVPMRVDVAYGRTWSDAKHTWGEAQG